MPETLSNIAGKAMLVQLQINTWSAVAVDEDATTTAEMHHQAQTGSGTYRKRLIDKQALAEVAKAARAAREAHRKLTLPWSDKGERILPTRAHQEYLATLTGLQNAFDVAVQGFMTAYAGHVQAAQASLGGLFKPDEYPDPADIAAKFDMGWTFAPLATGSDFRVDLPADEMQRMVEERDAQVSANVEAAQRDLYARIHTSMSGLVEACQRIDKAQEGERVQLRQSLLDHVAEAATAASTLDLTGDPKLAELADLAGRMVGSISREQLRSDEHLRTGFIAQADEIAKQMEGLV